MVLVKLPVLSQMFLQSTVLYILTHKGSLGAYKKSVKSNYYPSRFTSKENARKCSLH